MIRKVAVVLGCQLSTELDLLKRLKVKLLGGFAVFIDHIVFECSDLGLVEHSARLGSVVS